MMDPRDEADTEQPDRPEGDSLDALLARAAWPEPSPLQLARLNRHWRRLSARRRSGWWLAVAAVVIAAGMAVWLAAETRGRLDRPVDEASQPDSLLAEDRSPRSVPSDAKPEDDGADARAVATSESDREGTPEVSDLPPASATADNSRPPNHYEQLVLASAVRRQRSLPKPDTASEHAALLDEALDALSADAEADTAALAAKLLPQRDRHERRLLDMLAAAGDERRAAALALLPHVATWRSVPLLRQLASTGQASGSAKLALARLGTPDEAAWLVEAESDSAQRIALLSALAGRGERAAVSRLLRFLADPRWTSDALQALDDVEQPPLDHLFAALVGNDVRERQVAARALGRINGPEVTARLIGLALDGVYRQEAMLALVACRGAEAQAFVRQARQDLMLVAAVQAAESQFRQFSHSDPRNIP